MNIDGIITGLNKISLAAQLRDKLAEASNTDRRRCGNCYFWMMSRECPAEHNVAGMSRGPSCEASACGKFKLKPGVAELKAARISEAEEFADRHGLR